MANNEAEALTCGICKRKFSVYAAYIKSSKGKIICMNCWLKTPEGELPMTPAEQGKAQAQAKIERMMAEALKAGGYEDERAGVCGEGLTFFDEVPRYLFVNKWV